MDLIILGSDEPAGHSLLETIDGYLIFASSLTRIWKDRAEKQRNVNKHFSQFFPL